MICPQFATSSSFFEIRPSAAGYFDGKIQAEFPEMPPMVGFAVTATFRSATPPIKSAYVALESQVELFANLPGPVVVVFQDFDDPPVGATFGEMECSTYKAFGSVGLITSGDGRDLLQVKALGYPVFTGSTICSRAYCQSLDVGAPVRVGATITVLSRVATGPTGICQTLTKAYPFVSLVLVVRPRLLK